MKNTADSSAYSNIIAVVAIVIAVGFYVFSKPEPQSHAEAEASGVVIQPLAVGGTTEPASQATPSVGDAAVTANEPAKSEMTLPEFAELVQKTQAALPTLQSLRDLTDEQVHGVPDVIRDAGRDLGAIAQALHDNPHFAAEAASFYRECFAREDVPTQVRGLCLADHRILRMSNGDKVPWTEQELNVPSEVVRLAAQIPTT